MTAIETKHDINDMHLVRNSGLMFLANESPKIQTYFVPVSLFIVQNCSKFSFLIPLSKCLILLTKMLGPAPKWSSFLDNLTEELEENPTQELYDDYKFVTTKELEELGKILLLKYC